MGDQQIKYSFNRESENDERIKSYKMLFVSTFIGAIVIRLASALRNCDHCIKITQCREAVNRVVADKSETTSNMLRNAQCDVMKVCCSDFIFEGRNSLDSKNNTWNKMYNQIDNEDDIENHPKVNLLPDECGRLTAFGRIAGGKAAHMNEFPWLALISYNINGRKKFQCGGTVINKLNVLTAAHCIKGQTILDVRIGEYDIDSRIDCTGPGRSQTCQSNLQDIKVLKAIVHPCYKNKPILLNDIGLLHLMKPVNLSVANAGAICLPWQRTLRNMNITGQYGIIAGWGKTENRSMSNILLGANIPILDEKQCKLYYDGQYDESNKRFKNAFCAGESGRDSCTGDSGGPLMIKCYKEDQYHKLFQFGIVSYGLIQCGTSTPGVYMDVRKFMKWILDEMQP